MRSDDRDDLIDAAAHEMTRGEPSQRLRREVRTRIDKRRPVWAVPMWVPLVVAVALLIVVARTLSGPHGVPDRVRPTPVEQTAAAPRVVPPVVEASPSPRVGQITRPRRRPTRALQPINPLVIEPIAMPLMAVTTSSGVMPIDIDPLQVEPLQPE
jgi:hypothetical protein